MEEDISELALKCFDGDPEKAIALLQLLKLTIQPECDVPEAEMHLPEEVCRGEKDTQCWIDMPDSLRKCKKPCAYFEKRVK